MAKELWALERALCPFLDPYNEEAKRASSTTYIHTPPASRRLHANKLTKGGDGVMLMLGGVDTWSTSY